MLTDDPVRFLQAWRALPAEPWGSATPRMILMMSPDGLSATATTCADNRYMDASNIVDNALAHAQHRSLARSLGQRLPVCVMAGDPMTPDATFLNNAFATVPGRLITGAMRYPERQRETARTDVARLFELIGYEALGLHAPDVVAELTGSLVIDRLRGVGFCGLGERCNRRGAQAMHEAFGLRLMYVFDLDAREYHTNVVLSVLSGRTAVACGEALGQPMMDVLAEAYGDACINLSATEKNAFAGNCISVDPDTVWMSETAKCALSSQTRAAFERSGWRIGAVNLSEIEKAGGSLRCCVAEVF